MVKTKEINFSLLFIISFFLHVVVIIGLFSPNFNKLFEMEKLRRKSSFGGRDIIVNINQDKKRVIDRRTLLSDKDSSAKGYITKKRGNRWLNNSLDFKILVGSRSSRSSARKSAKKEKTKFLLSDRSEVVVQLKRFQDRAKDMISGQGGMNYKVLIPDKNDVTMRNAIFYSNKGAFSFNTAKFKYFHYFKNMKDKIASNWHFPGFNSVMGSYDPLSNTWIYAPGYTRVMTIPSQHVKLVFLMNREGDVLEVRILDSLGNRALNQSCIDAIQQSKNFGKVPEGIKGEVIVIPFIFGFYMY